MQGAAVVISFLVALGVVRLLLSRFGRFALDQPNARSLHATPVPRTGGIAILAGVAAASLVAGERLWLPLALAVALAAVSFADDVRGVPNRWRLAAHAGAAASVCWYFLAPIGLPEFLLLLLAVVWVTNLYNFMDGSDGVAGGMAVVGFSTYGIAAWQAGDALFSAASFSIAAAALAFLLYNFHPARIFLGDVGSIPLGFLAAALGLVGWRDDLWPLWFPLLVFGPFNADATITLLRRLARGERVWQPHREHYYQRIVRMGLGHRAAALIGYAVMLFCAASALLGRGQGPTGQAVAFFGASAVLAFMALWVDRRWARFAASA